MPGFRQEPSETLEQSARRELLEETGLTTGELTLVDVYSGPELVMRYPDGFAEYVVGATYATDDVVSDAAAYGEETLELGWFDLDDLPEQINDYNRALLLRAGLTPR